jgi:flagellar FliJ protein
MPKKFAFRLQGVLNYRKQVEEGRIRDLAKAKGVLLQVEEALQEHLDRQEDFRQEFARAQRAGGTVTAEVLASYGERWDALLHREKRLHALEREATEEVEKRRGMVMEASRDRKLLENLKKRKWTAYIHETEREEQKALDEFSAIAYVRKDLSPAPGSAEETLGR